MWLITDLKYRTASETTLIKCKNTVHVPEAEVAEANKVKTCHIFLFVSLL